ncbi:acyl-CoA synthetase [Mycobacterium sp. GA-1841]|uniref:AMP-binding protein n=1 Tax=Mycobacterium sp. GA-1841 TaxID=1834154 RepID=UPI00096C8F83|nr:AMP-binding protein [Mycobacterium sp. GA-1841]OMC31222.1 acyl-CoA synthetase [Mycobacterium sp. GA-1841]
MNLIAMLKDPARRAGLEMQSLIAVSRAGMIGIETPHRIVQIIKALTDYGPFGAAPRIAAIRHGQRAAVADELGELSFAELDEQVNRLANSLRATGLRPGANVGILCRNHRYPLIAAFAASRAGMSGTWLNTAFSAPQAREVAEREGIDLLIHDAEFDDVVTDINPPQGRVRCFTDDPADDQLAQLIAAGDPQRPAVPAKPGRIVLLTSGTTGTPKGAPRAEPKSLTLPGALLDRLPMRARETTVIGPPLFHGTGLIIALLSIALGSKLVLRRRFEAAEFLDDIERHRATTICVVPIMLQRILALGDEEVRRRDLSSLRVAFCAGSQLPATVAIAASDLLGEVIYNLYGSTEVSVATLATPADVRAAPTSVGKPALGSTVRIYDGDGNEVARGGTGRIFVGAATPFEGYTGGGGKEIIDGLMSTGDIGHFDDTGRLYIDGRDDEMIVSGGENVFPREVEELLVTHPAVIDVAVIGVDDPDFGQRLRAFCVLADNAQASEKELQSFVKENLARYKVPRDIVFLAELPRNPTGKVLKRELA